MDHWTFLIALHAFCASISLLLGGFQFLRPPKGDRWHGLVGRVYVVTLLITSFSSFFIGAYSTFMEWFLKFLAVTSIVSVTIGWFAARRGDKANHAGFMAGAYIGLLAAFVGVVAVPDRLIPTAFRVHTEEAVFATLALLAIAGAIVGVARLVARRRPRDVRPVG